MAKTKATPDKDGKVKIKAADGSNITMDSVDINDYKANTITDGHKEIYHGINIFGQSEFKTGIFNQRYRYGVLNPYQNITTAREVLFFTKPELNIFQYSGSISGGDAGDYDNKGMNRALANYAFFEDLYQRYPEVLYSLQASCGRGDRSPFNNLLGNMVQSNLDIPATTADLIETPANIYGVSYKYRGSSEAGDDNHSFSLEFKDTKYLPVYHFFKAYDMYEILKHHGAIRPNTYFITNKILHDQYSVYKFILDEDMETIIYYAKYYGVKSLNLPRDVFNTTTFDNGISYTIDFDAAFVEDMNPHILLDFNYVAYKYWNSLSINMPVYNTETHAVDMRSAKCAIVGVEQSGSTGYRVLGTNTRVDDVPNSQAHGLQSVPGQKLYKLKWRGDQKV